MSLLELSLGELSVHRCRRREVRETVSPPRLNTLLARFDRRQ
jgi:hypothetical protein